jgi:uncharacterized protein YcbK (DUF882 family)
LRAGKTRKSLKGSGIGTLTKALRTLFRTTAHAAFAASFIAVSGCTPTSGPDVAVATYGITAAPLPSQGQVAITNETAPDQAPAALVAANSAALDPVTPVGEAQAFVPGAVPPSAVLPQELASATNINPDAGAIANSGSYVTDGVEKTITAPAEKAAPLTPSDVAGQVPAPEAAPAKETQVAALIPAPESTPAQPDPIVAPKSARQAVEPKPTLFGSLFGNKPKKAQQSLTASPAEADATVQLASLETTNEEPAQQTESMNALPGVNSKNLFGLDPADKNAGEDSYEEEPAVQVASAAGMARLAPNGLLKQTDRVEVGCFKPELVSVLKKIEGHYGQKVVVTSGYRSPQGNRRAGGSRHSLHMMCAAADIQISGVGKWELAKYLRSMPGRGGVGTYCYTDSVHIDVGSERDWNWRCRRR